MSKALLDDATISLKWTGLATTAAIISAEFARFELAALAAKCLPIFPAEEQLAFKQQSEAAVSAAVLSHAGN